MYKIFFVLLLTFSCTAQKSTAFDPFNYNPQAYEKVKLFYELKGTGNTTLFFIPGWNLDHTIWQNQVAVFSPYYRLVLFDMAGCGRSSKNRKQTS